MLPPFSKLTTTDPDLNKVQDNLVRTLTPVFSTPVLGGSLIKSVQLVAGSNTINHNLGRVLIGWELSRQRGPASIYDNQDNNPSPNLSLILISSAAVSVDIYAW